MHSRTDVAVLMHIHSCWHQWHKLDQLRCISVRVANKRTVEELAGRMQIGADSNAITMLALDVTHRYDCEVGRTHHENILHCLLEGCLHVDDISIPCSAVLQFFTVFTVFCLHLSAKQGCNFSFDIQC